MSEEVDIPASVELPRSFKERGFCFEDTRFLSTVEKMVQYWYEKFGSAFLYWLDDLYPSMDWRPEGEPYQRPGTLSRYERYGDVIVPFVGLRDFRIDVLLTDYQRMVIRCYHRTIPFPLAGPLELNQDIHSYTQEKRGGAKKFGDDMIRGIEKVIERTMMFLDYEMYEKGVSTVTLNGVE